LFQTDAGSPLTTELHMFTLLFARKHLRYDETRHRCHLSSLPNYHNIGTECFARLCHRKKTAWYGETKSFAWAHKPALCPRSRLL